MGSRLNRIPEPRVAVFVNSVGTEFTKMPGMPRKVPKEKRAALYQMLLLVRETEAEMRAVLASYGIDTKKQGAHHLKRIWRERGR